MPSERITMRKIREVLRRRYACQLSLEAIARALSLSKGTVANYVKAAQQAQLNWSEVATLDEVALAKRLVPLRVKPGKRASQFIPPDYAWVYQELKRKSVTLQLLWEEYRERCPGRPWGYTSFCLHYRAWAQTLKRSMRQMHRAGEKLFVDYAGQTIPVVDPATGEIRQAQLFVAVLGASNYTFVTATAGQTTADWIDAHVQALRYIGGSPQMIVPDNARALIADPDRYEPGTGRAYAEFAAHYGCAVLPARPGHPRDKSKVEVGVQIAERWILARLRHQRLFSLAEVNRAIAALLADLNARPFKKLPGWKKARVSIDYHIEVDRHYYSVPHSLTGRDVEVRMTVKTIECFHQGKRVASHVNATGDPLTRTVSSRYSTLVEHMPKSHQAHREWSPGRLLSWGTSIGVHTHQVVRHLLESKPHPEMGYRACLGLIRLARMFGQQRLEAACTRAVSTRAMTYKSVCNILKSGLDRTPATRQTAQAELRLCAHDNVRGPQYYQ